MVTERLFQYIWQFQYFNKSNLQTVAGEPIEIIFPGELNKNQGPDFKQARIKIGNTLWAGEVEMHIKSSDWNKHHHASDNHYNKIILHVVWQNDQLITDKSNNLLPTLELQGRVSYLLLNQYEIWMNQKHAIPCNKEIYNISQIVWQKWKERLLVERLQQKAAHIDKLLDATNQHWEEVFWQLLCRYFGASVNSESFEQIAVSLPINILAKHKNQLHQLEALLLGQAGLLDETFLEHYPLTLKREYNFLKAKYKLESIIKKPVFLRIRPISFPTIRLAQLAMLIHQSIHLFSTIKETGNIKDIYKLFSVQAGAFWNEHFLLTENSEHRVKKVGKQMIDIIIINVVVPVLFAYGKYMADDNLSEKALQWLEQVVAEKNSITKIFTVLRVENKTAFDSQALLQLRNHYCDKKRCLECAIGNTILKIRR